MLSPCPTCRIGLLGHATREPGPLVAADVRTQDSARNDIPNRNLRPNAHTTHKPKIQLALRQQTELTHSHDVSILQCPKPMRNVARGSRARVGPHSTPSKLNFHDCPADSNSSVARSTADCDAPTSGLVRESTASQGAAASGCSRNGVSGAGACSKLASGLAVPTGRRKRADAIVPPDTCRPLAPKTGGDGDGAVGVDGGSSSTAGSVGVACAAAEPEG